MDSFQDIGNSKVSPDESCTSDLESNPYYKRKLEYSGVRCARENGSDALFGTASIWKNYYIK